MPRKKTAKPKDNGRPKIEIDWEQFNSLCRLQCTLTEIADYFKCSEATIERRVQEEKGRGFAEYFQLKRSGGKISLRRKQYQVAQSGNVTMLIWLGKQWLDQKDKQSVDSDLTVSGDLTVAHRIVGMSDNQLDNRIKELESNTKIPKA